MTGAVTFAGIGVLPVYLLGGLGPLISLDLGFGSTGLGAYVSLYFVVAALSSSVVGRWIDSVGAVRGARVGLLLNGLAVLGAGYLATSIPALAGFVAVMGLANGFLQPAANLLVAGQVRRARLGTGLGLKQAAIPGASMLAGVTVPLVAVAHGWRTTLVLMGGIALLATVFLPRSLDAPADPQSRNDRTPREADGAPATRLVVLAAAFGLGTFATMPIAIFLVDSAVQAGISLEHAGVLLAVGSILGIASRILGGWGADMKGLQPMRAVVVMLIVGGAGMAAMGLANTPTIYASGAMLACIAGWGWTGLYNFGIIAQFPDSPAHASGVALAGASVGAAIGPFAFGALADATAYTYAWGAGAAMAFVTAATLAFLPSLAGSRSS